MKLKSTLFVALLVMACPLLASDTIDRGVDAFTTLPNGETYYDFAANPVPADFFCRGSAPFTGRVTLGGAPIASAKPGALRGRDTFIERLDDATFNAEGIAETRVVFRALSMASMRPIDTGCGLYTVRVGLDGAQQVTTMRIYREQETGGTFHAPLAANVRLSFEPLARGHKTLSLPGQVEFRAKAIPWSFQPGPHARPLGPVTVDSDGDAAPETDLAGASNFAPGWAPAGFEGDAPISGCSPGCLMCEPYSCHQTPSEQHCTGPICSCGGTFACP